MHKFWRRHKLPRTKKINQVVYTWPYATKNIEVRERIGGLWNKVGPVFILVSKQLIMPFKARDTKRRHRTKTPCRQPIVSGLGDKIVKAKLVVTPLTYSSTHYSYTGEAVANWDFNGYVKQLDHSHLANNEHVRPRQFQIGPRKPYGVAPDISGNTC